jgi:hypothetical protein
LQAKSRHLDKKNASSKANTTECVKRFSIALDRKTVLKTSFKLVDSTELRIEKSKTKNVCKEKIEKGKRVPPGSEMRESRASDERNRTHTYVQRLEDVNFHVRVKSSPQARIENKSTGKV